MGSAAAWHLARDRRKVLLLERYEIAHSNGSSHGQSRIIRRSYTDPIYVPMVELSFRLWRELEAESGEGLMVTTGGLDLGPSDSEYLRSCRATMEQAGIPFDALDATNLRKRFPQFKVTDDTQANYQADAGILRATRCVETMVRMAQKHGAVVHANESVTDFHVWKGSIEIASDKNRYAAEHVVITGGSWNGPLMQKLGLNLPLEPLRQQKAYFEPLERAPFEVGRFPIWISKTYHPQIEEMYGFPWLAGTPGIKLALHNADQSRERCDPNNMNRTLDPNYIGWLRKWLEQHIPGAAGKYKEGAVCIYTMTPDRNFILDRHPEYPQIAFGAGFSGTGFKFGVGIGRILADLATKGTGPVDLTPFRLERFASAIPG